MSGVEAAQCGFANRHFPEAELEDRVLEIAERVARTPSDLQQINKAKDAAAAAAGGAEPYPVESKKGL